jgi:hypothetical protein
MRNDLMQIPKRRTLLSLFCALFLLGGGDLQAETTPEELQKDAYFENFNQTTKSSDIARKIFECAETEGRVNRLGCFDDLSEELGFISPEVAQLEATVLEVYGFWEVTKKQSEAGEDLIFLKTESVKPVVSNSGLSRRVPLMLKCSRGQTDVYIDWGAKLYPRSISVTKMMIEYQMDMDTGLQEAWEVSLDQRALFSPNPIAFIKQLQAKNSIVCNIIPEYEQPQTIVFETRGLNEALKILIRDCYNN